MQLGKLQSRLWFRKVTPDWWWGERVGHCATVQVKEDVTLDQCSKSDGGKFLEIFGRLRQQCFYWRMQVRIRGEKDYIWAFGQTAVPTVKLKNTINRAILMVKNPGLGKLIL